MHFPTSRQIGSTLAALTLAIALSGCSALGFGADTSSTTTTTKTVTRTVEAQPTVDAEAPVDCNVDLDCTTPPVPTSTSSSDDDCVKYGICTFDPSSQDGSSIGPVEVFVCALFSNSDGTISMMSPNHMDYFFPVQLTGFAANIGVQKWVKVTYTSMTQGIADVVTVTPSDVAVTDQDIQSCGG